MASAAEQLAANLNVEAFAKATDLHKRLTFTLVAMIVYRIGCYVPIPGIDIAKFAAAFQGQANGILGMFNMFSGGAVRNMAVFALNVMPYISASIIVQLLGTVYPPWEKLRKEGGEAGRKQLNQYTRYLTVVLAVFQSFGIAVGLQSGGIADNPGPFFIVCTMATLTGGTLFLMWLGEQITSRGVGNGVSLIIFAGIVAVFPRYIAQAFSLARTGAMNGGVLLLVMALVVGVTMAIVFMERSQRRLLVQYPKRQVGNRMFGGDTSFLPLKINTSGVIPPIFASSLLLLPTTIANFSQARGGTGILATIALYLGHGQPLYMLMYVALIVFFAFFYTAIVLNTTDTADNLKKHGGFIHGIRPGEKTAKYLDSILVRITCLGAGYLCLICLLPEFLISYWALPFYFGGTSLLIVVSVTMDTVAQIHGHLQAHQYEGLIKKAKLRGSKR